MSASIKCESDSVDETREGRARKEGCKQDKQTKTSLKQKESRHGLIQPPHPRPEQRVVRVEARARAVVVGARIVTQTVPKAMVVQHRLHFAADPERPRRPRVGRELRAPVGRDARRAGGAGAEALKSLGGCTPGGRIDVDRYRNSNVGVEEWIDEDAG